MPTPPTSPAARRRPPSSRRKAASAVVRTVAVSALAAVVQVLSGAPSVADLLAAVPQAAPACAAPLARGEFVAFANGQSANGVFECADAAHCATCRKSPRPAVPQCGQ